VGTQRQRNLRLKRLQHGMGLEDVLMQLGVLWRMHGHHERVADGRGAGRCEAAGFAGVVMHVEYRFEQTAAVVAVLGVQDRFPLPKSARSSASVRKSADGKKLTDEALAAPALRLLLLGRKVMPRPAFV